MKLVRAGFVVAGLTLLLPILWPVAVVLGILVLRGPHQTQGGLILFLGAFLMPAIGGAVWLALLVGAYRAPSESMEPNVKMNSRFVVWKLDYEPKVGDVAVFEAPASSQQLNGCLEEPGRGQMCDTPDGEISGVQFIKRVVAGPGDKIKMVEGRIIRNGEPESGYELRKCGGEFAGECDFPTEITVPRGHYFVLGDNRGASQDSRFWGPVPAEHFIGRRLFTYWPG